MSFDFFSATRGGRGGGGSRATPPPNTRCFFLMQHRFLHNGEGGSKPNPLIETHRDKRNARMPLCLMVCSVVCEIKSLARRYSDKTMPTNNEALVLINIQGGRFLA